MPKKIYKKDYLDFTVDHGSQELKFRIMNFKYSIGKCFEEDSYNGKRITEYSLNYLDKLLSEDYGRNFPYIYADDDNRFINSSFVSSYIKYYIIKYLNKYGKPNNTDDSYNLYESARKALLSCNSFSYMSYDEIKAIIDAIGGYNKLPEIFKNYLFHLNSKVVSEYIDKNVNKVDLVREILYRSGLSSRSEFYSGRGVNRGDLNERHLSSIFNKLYKINPEYSLQFFNMVKSMKTLGATEFIDSLYRFARKDFKCENLEIATNNIVSDNSTHDSILLGVISSLGKVNDYSSKEYESNIIKASFAELTLPLLDTINPELRPEIEKYIRDVRDKFVRGRRM